MREDVMALDLNQEPADHPHEPFVGLELILNELETAHERIEERIRQIEAVALRATQRRRWHAIGNPEITNVTSGHAATDSQDEDLLHTRDTDNAAPEGNTASFKGRKRDYTLLIAKALEMDPSTKEESNRGSYFDCNICLYMARDPILTCCGHLFCWPCFYQLSYTDLNAKECPVCKGEVTDTSIIPIYGGGNGNYSRKSKASGLEVPPRPNARRIESMRQQLLSHGPSPSMIEERIVQLSNIIGAMGERTRALDSFIAQPAGERSSFVPSRYRTSRTLPPLETTSNRHFDFGQVSRLSLQGAAPFSSHSSALNSEMDSVERLVENQEAYSNNRHMRTDQQSLHVDSADTASYVAEFIQPEIQTSEVTGEISASMVVPPSLSFRTDIAPAVVGSENQTMNAEINSTVLPSSSRRRSGMPRVSGVSNEVPRETRRRRLR
ncbi:hypothetical protein FNV43_RR06062 [Rhamnella rubrinervis]|uniref:E3 ubiquitin-protein ligase RMA n=1 Tax=Rhamnella rubrinervis TaxID=2594499 RepID=A0A8K0HDV1_9ROSA|nr:hypothetical protein FNV43_RR06062 [Rhamnella rubrinervis]